MCICPLSQSKSTPRDKDECPVFVKSACVYREVPRLNNEIRYAHHHTPQKDKNANLCNYCDLRGQIFSILKFFAHFPLRMSNARNISYLLVCVGTPGVLDGLKARSDQKKTLFPFRPRTRRTVKPLDCESICICIQKQ